jgi:hypothetical protein
MRTHLARDHRGPCRADIHGTLFCFSGGGRNDKRHSHARGRNTLQRNTVCHGE